MSDDKGKKPLPTSSTRPEGGKHADGNKGRVGDGGRDGEAPTGKRRKAPSEDDDT